MLMLTRYLVRFDDICPTMNWTVWRQVEDALVEEGVQPILAVVPDNRDPNLTFDWPEPRFWRRVRRWQAQGWTIGLHGYHHRYETGDAGIIGRNRYSEFAGLSRAAQRRKIAAALEVFAQEGVVPDVWVAPAHSFDAITLEELAERGVRFVSDGYSLLPHLDERGLLWVPQQLGRFRRMPFGLWTVCLHHNRWRAAEISEFRARLKQYRARIASFREVVETYAEREARLADRLSRESIRLVRSLRRALGHAMGNAAL
jgi:predicted deacetylase